jgi:hypothetical protein
MRTGCFVTTMHASDVAFITSWASIVLTSIAFGGGIAVYLSSSSSAILGFALENLVDLGTSLLMLWRFWGGGRAAVSEAQLQLREKRASVGVAFAFILLAVAVICNAALQLSTAHVVADRSAVLSLCIPSVALLTPLGVIKVWTGRFAASASLKKDGCCTLAAAVLSLIAAIDVSLVDSNPSIWYVDSVATLVVCVALLLAGMTTLAKNAMQGVPWWTPSWWTMPSTGLYKMRSGGSTMKPLPEFSSPEPRATRQGRGGSEHTTTRNTPSPSSSESPTEVSPNSATSASPPSYVPYPASAEDQPSYVPYVNGPPALDTPGDTRV